jgi:3-oxoacyl-[acyl-carrier-protein] synthase III
VVERTPEYLESFLVSWPFELVMVKPKTKRAAPDRSKISMENEAVVKYWTKHLGITRERLQNIVEKVGNSAASVRKELKS